MECIMKQSYHGLIWWYQTLIWWFHGLKRHISLNPSSKRKYDRIPHDYEKSLQLLKESAGYLYQPALYELGLKYYRGNGVEVDQKSAFELFMSAAELKYPRAMFYVSLCMHKGIGTDVNQEDSLKWCKWGARLGDPRCQERLDSLFAQGLNI